MNKPKLVALLKKWQMCHYKILEKNYAEVTINEGKTYKKLVKEIIKWWESVKAHYTLKWSAYVFNNLTEHPYQIKVMHVADCVHEVAFFYTPKKVSKVKSKKSKSKKGK